MVGLDDRIPHSSLGSARLKGRQPEQSVNTQGRR